MRTIYILLSLFLLLNSCADSNRKPKAENLLVEVEGSFLYKKDLEAVMPSGLSPDDSISFAESFIRNWIEDVLLYNKAKSNIPDNSQIEALVENYRKALIVHAYQQELLNQRFSAEISEQEISSFYEENKHLFILERPLIKGLFIKVPLGAPQVNDVRRWYKSKSHDAVEMLEKYSLQHAISYDYFYDKWVAVSEVLGKLPLEEERPEDFILKNRQIELKDSIYYYFLNVTDYLGKEAEEPYDFVRPKAKEMLLNLRKTEFVNTVKTELFNRAEKRNKIIYNY